MLKIYGSRLCKDCRACMEEFDRDGVSYVFLDFGDDLQNLKDFLKIRDQWDIFRSAKADGRIGIPCIVREDGSVTLDLESLLSHQE